MAILIAGVLLCVTRIVWRVMAGVFVGMAVTASVFNMIPSSNPMFDMPFYSALSAWWLCVWSYFHGHRSCFGGNDRYRSLVLRHADWFYVRIDPGKSSVSEGMMLAILFGNLFAPLMDHCIAIEHQAEVGTWLKKCKGAEQRRSSEYFSYRGIPLPDLSNSSALIGGFA